MDRLDHYRNLVMGILNEYASIKPAHGDVEMQTIFDRERDHYQLFTVGWDGLRRLHGRG